MEGQSPMWTILSQVYTYTSLLDRAIKQLCNISIVQESDTLQFRSFCTSTVLASNQADSFLNPSDKNTLGKQASGKLLHSLIATTTDKHGRARLASYETELILLHKRLGEDILVFLLTRCSLFAQVGRNYVQLLGIPLYNILALNYTPLPKKRGPVKKRGRGKRQRANAARANAIAHHEASAPLAKKQRITDPQEEKQPNLTPTESNVPTPVFENATLQHGACSARAEDAGMRVTTSYKPCKKRKRRKRRITMKLSRNSPCRFWRRKTHTRKRKRLTSRLRKQLNGNCNMSLAERVLQKSIHTVLQTSYRKIDVMYSPTPKEGLKKSHILNVTNATRRGAIRLIAKVFMSKTQSRVSHKKSPGKFANKKINRLPKRLLAVAPLFQTLLSNYRQKYRKLIHILNTLCPMPSPIEPQVAKGVAEKHDYVERIAVPCSHTQVFRFIMCVLNSLLPAKLWGSPESKKKIFGCLQNFVSLRRWERVSVWQLMQGVKTTQCAWLQVCDGRPVSRSEALKQTELLGLFLAWLMSLVMDIVKGFFYVTEHCDHHNRVLYYRKPIWNQLCQMALQDREEVMLVKLNQGEVDLMLSRGKSLGISNLRFLPKASSLRPITNLGSAAKFDSAYFVQSALAGQREPKSVNNQLLHLFSVLKFEKSRQVCSNSCLGYGDIHKRLSCFSKRLQQASVQVDRPPLYSVHVDITNCFDSVEPRLLYSIIRNRILTQQSYLLRRYTTVMLSNRTIKRSFVKAATTRELCQPFVKFACDLSHNTSLRNAILTDMVAYPVIDRVQLLSQLKSHLFNNVVRFRGQFFRQTKGIPQGSCISSLLCSFYYDEMEREHLPNINPDTGLLMHYVDDFLLLTQDPSTARKFLEIMTNGIPDYNCYVNPTKTSTNFSVHDDGTVHLDSEKQWMKWCGLLINTRNLEVRYDYSRYTRKKIRDNLTIVSHTRPFHNLLRLVKRAVRLRCLPIFLDCKLLSEKTVLINIYQLFLLVAVKLHAAVRALQLPRGRRYTRFFLSCIQQSTRFFYSLARNKCKNAEEQTSFTLPQELCTWLGCHAYQRVLQKKDPGGHTYGLLVKVLSSRINTVADTMGLDQVKRCLRATSLADCQPIFRVKC